MKPWEEYQSEPVSDTKPWEEYSAPSQKKGFFSNVGRDWSERGENISEIQQADTGGKQTKLESALQATGQVFGGAGDVYAQGVASAAKTGYEMLPKGAQSTLKETGQALINSPLGQAGMRALELGGEEWKKFEQENPRAARNLAAVGNIGAFFVPVKGKTLAGVTKDIGEAGIEGAAKVAGAPLNYVSEGISTVAKGINPKNAEDIEGIVSGIKGTSRKNYEIMRQAGARITPEKTNEILTSIDSSLKSKGKLNPELHRKTLSVLGDLAETAKAGGIDLEELDQYRRLLSRIKPGLENGEDAFMAGRAVNAIDDIIENMDAKALTSGDPKAINGLDAARRDWTRASKIERIGEILRQADGDPNRIKAGLTRFVNKKKNLNGFTEEEKRLLKRAASSTTAEKLLKMGGKFGIDLGTSLTSGNTVAPLIGGIAGGAIASPGIGGGVVAAGTLSRQLQKYMARGKAEDVIRQLQKGGVPKEVRNLPPKEAMEIIKQARKK